MRQEEIRHTADRLSIELAEETPAALISRIRRELGELQAMDTSADNTERTRELLDAMQLIKADMAEPSETPLVAVSRGELVEILRAAATGEEGSEKPARELRKGVQVASVQARKDFRNARSLPLAGFGAFVLLVWSQRETFGVDLTGMGSTVFAAIGAAAISTALLGYLFAWRVQRRDEFRLRSIYRPEVHAEALRAVASNSRGTEAEVFTLQEFRDEIFHLVDGWPRGGLARILSTVDLYAALDDASELALERYVKLGIIEPVESWSGLEYRATARFRE